LGANLVLNGIEADAEYMLALSREEYQGTTQEFTESVLSLGLAYELVVREREVLGGALFAKRKAHIVTEPLEIGVRYEYFDDDGLADAFGTWSVEQRVSAGGRGATRSTTTWRAGLPPTWAPSTGTRTTTTRL
jgi:hypothetical protein